MDTLEQRLTADLTDAAEAAMNTGLTPPDRDAIAAGVAARRRRRRLRLAVAVAACVLAVGGAVAALTGDSLSRTEMAPPAQQSTERPTTTTTATTTTTTTTPSTTAPTGPSTPGTSVPGSGPPPSPSTTPNDPEQPVPEAITEADLRSITVPFSVGVANLPPACRDYWTNTVSESPADQGFGPDQNAIEVITDRVDVGDIDGDGIDDGVAAFRCTTAGTVPPGGVVVMRAADRVRIYDDGTLSQQAVDRLGAVGAAPVGASVITDSGGDWTVHVSLAVWMPSDANCCPSNGAYATFRAVDDRLELVDYGQAPL